MQARGLNDLARRFRLLASDGAVDTAALKKRITAAGFPPSVFFGHLLPHAFDGGALSKVVVLRCEPKVLRERLRVRGYPPERVVENLEAELIGVVSAEAYRTFGTGKTFEFDTTSTGPDKAAGSVLAILRGEARPRRRIDWTGGYDSGAKLRSLVSSDM